MFFKKKDYTYYQNKGERQLKDQHVADARISFQEALDLLSDDLRAGAAGDRLRVLLAATGNQLAERNIDEAEVASRGGDLAKAHEHLVLAQTLAEDVTLREKAEKLQAALHPVEHAREVENKNHNCTTCASSNNSKPLDQRSTEDFLTSVERFELLIQPLPSDLSKRYAELGEKFAVAYLLAAEGNHEQSLQLLVELLADDANDILLYEAAVQLHALGKLAECETSLQHAHRLNNTNPLCCIGLVQLYCETGKIPEALELLQSMLDTNVERDQALLYMGDIYHEQNDPDRAVDCYSRLLSGTSARLAAERLIPLLETSGRTEDARSLYKRFMKGCC